MAQSVYLQRYASQNPQITTPPDPTLGLVIAIPCYAEPDLITTLNSLSQCQIPTCGVDVIVMINHSETDPVRVKTVNGTTLSQASDWAQTRDTPLTFHLLSQSLPAKHAGVGMARKLAMDEAVRRFEALHRDGIIASLDADCTCAANYLQALVTHFDSNDKTPGCSIYFEHPLSGPLEARIYQGIATYELHLRYYVHALRYAGLPWAYQTVGSAMAVRSSSYQKQGGMNRRKAGEDFYFLQKIMKLGHFTELRNTKVIPSPRMSNRVPFGTGKAMRDWMAKGQKILTYNLNTFRDLKGFISCINLLYDCPAIDLKDRWDEQPDSVRTFLPYTVFKKSIMQHRQHSRDFNGFRKRFFRWCDGFFAFKFANHCRNHFYPATDVSRAALNLWAKISALPFNTENLMELLLAYRRLDGASEQME